MTDDARVRTSSGTGRDDDVIRVFDDPADIDSAVWDALVAAQPSATPFVSMAYLRALHESASAVAATGWAPHFLVLEHGGEIVAACPLYLKDHSYGEYVFDWAWADAYQRHGLDYYPKLLDAIPFTPVPGPRLLARTPEHRLMLVRAIEQLARSAQLSSAHLLFLDEDDQAAARAAGWSLRTTVQFHWSNRAPAPYADFADFLASLQRDKRKKIQQERRRVAEAGVAFTVATRRRDRGGRLGLLLSLLHPHVSRASFDAVPDARLLRAARRRRWRATGCSSPPGAATSESPRR